MKLELLCTSLLILIIWGCYENQEGCLDALANNFDIEADRDCCCEYPSLILQYDHVVDTASYSSSVWYDIANSVFQITSAQFYVSAFSLSDSLGQIAHIRDSISIGMAEVADDAALVSAGSFNSTVGDFIAPGRYKSIMFNVGLTDILDGADPSLFDENHPLDTAIAMFDEDLGYLDWSMELNLVTGSDTLARMFSGQLDNQEKALTINVSKGKGENLNVVLQIDYAEWLEGVDLISDPDDEVERSISRSLINSIRVL